MRNLSHLIKEILVNITVDDKLPMDMTMLDESLFDDILTEENLKGSLNELGCNTELVISTDDVDKVIKQHNSFKGLNIIIDDEEKKEIIRCVNYDDLKEHGLSALREIIEHEDYK